MSIDLKVYDNGDHTCLVWVPTDEKPIANCLGFAIRRICNGTENYLHGFVGFSASETLDPKNPWKFPVQRYTWWDYGVQPGNVVQYSVVPVIGPHDTMKLDPSLASELTPEMKIDGQCTPNISAYFNKGIVAAQWVSKVLDAEPKGSNLKTLVATAGNDLRDKLSGLLRPELLKLLDQTNQAKGKIFAALYELNDSELIPGLKAFGQRCSLILGNGAFKPPSNDENVAVRADMKKSVQVFDRIVSSPHFAHNKFVVFCDADGKPHTVLTGSTNWTSSGLCTQANNAIIVKDDKVAQDYLDAWNRIKDAGNGFPPALAAANSKSASFTVDGCKITPWFVPTQKAEDLVYARTLINGAKQGILFLFFNPGTYQTDPTKWTLLQNILNRHNATSNPNFDASLYIKGVVNQEIPNLTEDGKPADATTPAAAHSPTTTAEPVALFSNGVESPLQLSHDVMVPANVKAKYAGWDKELLGAGLVNIHSKVIVIDPFGDHPVLMTGSHNLGFKASTENDDNLMIVEGNAPLAAAYAVNIIAIFDSYRWNHYTQNNATDPKAWKGLEPDDKWQTGYLTGEKLAELQFWLNEKKTAEAAPPTVTPKTVQTAHTARTTRAPAKVKAAGTSKAK